MLNERQHILCSPETKAYEARDVCLNSGIPFLSLPEIVYQTLVNRILLTREDIVDLMKILIGHKTSTLQIDLDSPRNAPGDRLSVTPDMEINLLFQIFYYPYQLAYRYFDISEWIRDIFSDAVSEICTILGIDTRRCHDHYYTAMN